MLKFLSASVNQMTVAKRIQIMLLGAALGLAVANMFGFFVTTGSSADTIGLFSGATLSGIFAKKLVLFT
jgi:hypothetical protein